MNKSSGNITGIILLVIGIIIGVIGLFSFINIPLRMVNTEINSNPFSFISNVFFNAGLGIVGIFVGAILIIVAIVILYLVNIRKTSSFMARETAPAVETSAHAFGKGLSRGLKKSSR